jgi:hypothetical protein
MSGTKFGKITRVGPSRVLRLSLKVALIGNARKSNVRFGDSLLRPHSLIPDRGGLCIAPLQRLHRTVDQVLHRLMQDSALVYQLLFIRAARQAISPLNVGGPLLLVFPARLLQFVESRTMRHVSAACVTAIHVNRFHA